MAYGTGKTERPTLDLLLRRRSHLNFHSHSNIEGYLESYRREADDVEVISSTHMHYTGTTFKCRTLPDANKESFALSAGTNRRQDRTHPKHHLQESLRYTNSCAQLSQPASELDEASLFRGWKNGGGSSTSFEL